PRLDVAWQGDLLTGNAALWRDGGHHRHRDLVGPFRDLALLLPAQQDAGGGNADRDQERNRSNPARLASSLRRFRSSLARIRLRLLRMGLKQGFSPWSLARPLRRCSRR